MRLAARLVGAGFLLACSDPDGSGPLAPGGGTGGAVQSAGTSSSGGASAGAAISGGGGSGSGGGNAGRGGDAPLVELPAGSTEYEGIVNLVDAEAAAELDAYILDEKLALPTTRHGLNKSLNLFLDHYQETYDFVFLFNDHLLEQATNYGKFEDVTHHTGPGGISEYEVVAEGYKTNGRVRGVIGVPYHPHLYPPLAHETVHHWGVFLDDSFGFGSGLTPQDSVPVHWGYVDMNGQLGGFDGATLRCETPADAVPPNCTGSNGRIRYVMGAFGPNANAFRSPPYAPMELYLMGLVPPEKVPSSFRMLTDATFAETPNQESAVIEASGIKEIAFADIQKRHGVARLLPDAERHFSAAFVIISKVPAAESVLADVATFASVFGNRSHDNGWKSFEETTVGLSTMTTTLGARRKQNDPAPAARPTFTCDLLLQDCGRPELACHGAEQSFCALAGSTTRDMPCTSDTQCGRGLGCIGLSATPADFVCEPYCDLDSDATVSSCDSLCPDQYFMLVDAAQQPVAGQCAPPP